MKFSNTSLQRRLNPLSQNQLNLSVALSYLTNISTSKPGLTKWLTNILSTGHTLERQGMHAV